MIKMNAKNATPFISVLVGSKDRPDSLERCLKSILVQTYDKLEILILDDGSQQNLASFLVPKYSAGNIRWFRSDHPLGVTAGRNKLIKEAAGEWIIILDDDAVFQNSHALEKIVEQILVSPQVGLFAFKIIDIVEGKEVRYRIPFRQKVIRQDPGIVDRSELVSYFLGGGHAVYKEVFQQCGLYPDDFIYGGEEMDLSYRMLEKGYHILYLPQIVVHHFPESFDPISITKRTQYTYYSVRNRTWIAHRYLPWRMLCLHLPIWFGIFLFFALRKGGLKDTFRGIKDGLHAFGHRQRTPISKDTWKYLKAHHGRMIL